MQHIPILAAVNSAAAANDCGYPVPLNELARQQALQELCVLDTPTEEVYDAITRQAMHLCKTPIALISLIDRDRQWFKSQAGTKMPADTPRQFSFCTHAILEKQVFEITDAYEDPRFANNPLVTGDPSIRAYLGVPLLTSQGHALGTLCVVDTIPRQMTPSQITSLRDLGQIVSALLESRKTTAEATQLSRVLNQAFDEILVTYPESLHVQYASEGALQNLGYAQSELQKISLRGISSDYPFDKFDALMKEARQGTRSSFVFEALQTRKNGTMYPVEIRATVSSSDVLPQLVLLINDISERKQHENVLKERAAVNFITQLPNRQQFETRLSTAIAQLNSRQKSRNSHGVMAVVMMEIKNFREIRHAFGLDAADEVLREFSRRLTRCAGHVGLVSHLGGDEFAVLIEDSNFAGLVESVCLELQQALEQPFQRADSLIRVRANIGAAYFDGGTETGDELLCRVDESVNLAAMNGVGLHISELLPSRRQPSMLLVG